MEIKTDFMSDEDKTILNCYDDYGVYLMKGEGEKELYSTKGMNQPLYITLDLEKSSFAIDYSEYIAKAQDIKFGTYTKDGYGSIKYYDE